MKLSIINIDPEILGGTPVFRGTRTPIQVLFDYLRSSSLDDFLRGYPHISKEMAYEVLQEKNNRHFLLQQAANDPLFLADIEQINGDFKHI